VAPDGRPIYADLEDLGISNLVALDNFDEGSSNTFTATVAKDYENGFGFQLSYAHQDAETVTPGTSSRGISNFRAIEDSDRNFPSAGRSPFEVEHAFKVFLDYETEIFKGLKSQFSLFGDIQSGANFGYGYNIDEDNALFGRPGDGEDPNRGNDLLYIPSFDASGFNDSRVVFASGFDQSRFLQVVRDRDLGNGEIAERNLDNGPWNQFWDFRYVQELPFANFGMKRLEGNKLKFVLDIENVANLINDEWGTFRVTNGDQSLVNADLVSAADVAANGIDGATALTGDAPRTTCLSAGDCVYRYNELDVDEVGRASSNTAASVYSMRIGFRYEF
jgi:hypothetical protein